MKKFEKFYKIVSIDEGNGVVVIEATRKELEGKKIAVKIDGVAVLGCWQHSQYWIQLGKPLGSTYSIEI